MFHDQRIRQFAKTKITNETKYFHYKRLDWYLSAEIGLDRMKASNTGFWCQIF